MQRTAGAFIGKKIKDELFAAPKPRTADGARDATDSAPPAEPADDIDGTLIEDEEGLVVGTAHRVPGVAVYVAFEGYGNSQRVLADCVGEADTRLLLTTDDAGRIAALIYVPDPSRAERRPQAMRPDDV